MEDFFFSVFVKLDAVFRITYNVIDCAYRLNMRIYMSVRKKERKKERTNERKKEGKKTEENTVVKKKMKGKCFVTPKGSCGGLFFRLGRKSPEFFAGQMMELTEKYIFPPSEILIGYYSS